VNRSPDLTDATLGQYQIEALIGPGGMVSASSPQFRVRRFSM
jgi:hypothetical protein